MNIFTNTDTINKPIQTQIDGLQIENKTFSKEGGIIKVLLIMTLNRAKEISEKCAKENLISRNIDSCWFLTTWFF